MNNNKTNKNIFMHFIKVFEIDGFGKNIYNKYVIQSKRCHIGIPLNRTRSGIFIWTAIDIKFGRTFSISKILDWKV